MAANASLSTLDPGRPSAGWAWVDRQEGTFFLGNIYHVLLRTFGA